VPSNVPPARRVQVTVVGRRALVGGLGAMLLVRPAWAGAMRVACLDWALTETMLALGHDPIAIVAAGDWNRFVIDPALPPATVDLGLQQEVNLELLAALAPDLILTSPFLGHLDTTLRRIARTEQLSIFTKTSRLLEQPRALTRQVGDLLGLQVQAGRYLDAAEQVFDRCRARVSALSPPPLLVVSFIDARHVRVYGGAGLFQNVFERIGVVNAWTGETNDWGFTTVGVERLAMDRRLRLFVLEPLPPDVAPVLAVSPLWQELPFVRAKSVTTIPPVFMFGAVPSALRFAHVVVQELEGAAG
jgi:ferric hydroxamate transport system substrate-binding protein